MLAIFSVLKGLINEYNLFEGLQMNVKMFGGE